MTNRHLNSMQNDDRKIDAVLRDVDADEADPLREVWDLLKGQGTREYPSPERAAAARREVLAALSEPARLPGNARRDRAPRRRPRGRRPNLWPAAVLVAALLFVWWVRPKAVQSPRGERMTVALPDGSRVQLNSGARLRFSEALYDLGVHRRVRLDGEAFFDVTPSSEPFVVRTFNGSATVLGTRFNVRAWRDLEMSTVVTVESGRVRVAPAAGDGRGVIVSAGKSARIAADDAAVDSMSVRVADALAWRRGDLIYLDRMLGVILEDVSRRFDVVVRLDPSIPVTTRLGFVHRDPPGPEVVVRDLAGALGLRYRARSNGFELYRPSPP